MKDRYTTDNELTVFGPIDLGNTSFNPAVQIQDTLFHWDWDVHLEDSSSCGYY